MNKEQIVSMALYATRKVNNPNVCIKSFASTFVCVCKDCMKKDFENIEKLTKEINNYE